jgi:hypothetical protein
MSSKRRNFKENRIDSKSSSESKDKYFEYAKKSLQVNQSKELYHVIRESSYITYIQDKRGRLFDDSVVNRRSSQTNDLKNILCCQDRKHSSSMSVPFLLTGSYETNIYHDIYDIPKHITSSSAHHNNYMFQMKNLALEPHVRSFMGESYRNHSACNSLWPKASSAIYHKPKNKMSIWESCPSSSGNVESYPILHPDLFSDMSSKISQGQSSNDHNLILSNFTKQYKPKLKKNILTWEENFKSKMSTTSIEECFRPVPTCVREMIRKYSYLSEPKCLNYVVKKKRRTVDYEKESRLNQEHSHIVDGLDNGNCPLASTYYEPSSSQINVSNNDEKLNDNHQKNHEEYEVFSFDHNNIMNAFEKCSKGLMIAMPEEYLNESFTDFSTNKNVINRSRKQQLNQIGIEKLNEYYSSYEPELYSRNDLQVKHIRQ